MVADIQHRAKFHQLWIDQVHEQLRRTPLLRDLERTVRLGMLARITRWSREHILSLSPEELRLQFLAYDLVDPPPAVALRALKACGYPDHELVSTVDDVRACEAKVNGALHWCGFSILGGHDTHLMLLDDRTAKAVVDSKNVPITPAELQQLPHNPCLIEFYRPIEVAEHLKRGIRVRAVGFMALGSVEAPAAVGYLFLDNWETESETKARWPITISFWFGGLNMMDIDHGAYVQLGFMPGSSVEQGLLDFGRYAGRNVWDFITSRSIRYEQFVRKPRRLADAGKQLATAPKVEALSDRHVTFLYLARDAKSSPEPREETSQATLTYRIEVLGTFHEYVYCAACGDLHRHDLLGQPCRKCGVTVGPRANVRVEKYWHSPYIKGPEGAPLKEVIRDVHRKKRR